MIIDTEFTCNGKRIIIVPSSESFGVVYLGGEPFYIVPLASSKHMEYLRNCIQELESILYQSEIQSQEVELQLNQRKQEHSYLLRYRGSRNENHHIELLNEIRDHDKESVSFISEKDFEYHFMPNDSKIPLIRQFYKEEILYRQYDKMQVQWVELFYDLIYAGAFAKSSYLMDAGRSWTSYYQLFLIFNPLVSRWREQTMLHNMIHHNSFVFHVFEFLIIGIVVVMIITMEHSFDMESNTNTAVIFLACHMVAGTLIELYLIVAQFNSFAFSIPELTYKLLMTYVGYIPYFVLISYPPDSNLQRANLRMSLWLLGVLLEIVIHSAPFFIYRVLKTKHRVAINIEHFAERYRLLVVIMLGEIILSFLQTFKMGDSYLGILNVLMALLTTSCLFYLYFRTEVHRFHIHAMNRHYFTNVMWTSILQLM